MLLPRTLVLLIAATWSAMVAFAALAQEAHLDASGSTALQSERLAGTVYFDKKDLEHRFLLQVSHAQRGSGWQDFMTSRSRIVTFERQGDTLQMLEDTHDPGASLKTRAGIPIRGETKSSLLLDFNAGFDKISEEEDRTGEDYYGRQEQRDGRFVPLQKRELMRVSRIDSMLVFEQHALADNDPVSVYYYLSPYGPDVGFEPFELKNLDHFGFYETYPQQVSGHTVLYATKFNSRKPIVFALSTNIPARYRESVRDGVLYWNRVLGRKMIQVVDAPAGVTAPNPKYNVIQWVADGSFASTSHIQADPLTGEILHAHIFMDARDLDGETLGVPNDHLRYLVAHEVGHALGLRHNFAKGRTTTVMNYFTFKASVTLGREIRSSRAGLEYDRRVMRHVYLDEALDLATLPAFCTDNQPDCGPFPVRARHGGE